MLAEVDARVGPRLYRYALAILGSPADAEEIVQDLFVTLAETDAARWPAQVDHYLIRSARNAAIRRLQGARRRLALLKAEAPALVPREASDPALQDFAAKASRALGQLPIEQKEAVALHLFEGMGFKEIGKATEVSLDTAASRYRYGIEKLKELLADEQP